jgi:carboxymethylenebutenolidase
MKRYTLLWAALALAAPAFAQTPPQGRPAQTPAFTPPPNDKIPVGDTGTNSADALKRSPRHGEWVDIKMTTGPALKSWVVYPERRDKAGVVLVIFDIFGMGDWARAVGDQLAKDGFIAIVPDFLSGKGPNGGGSEELGTQVGSVIRTLTPADLNARLDAAMAYGKSLPSSNGKTATIGFCWGGGVSFGYAVAQPNLSAAAVYYGTPPMSAPPLPPPPPAGSQGAPPPARGAGGPQAVDAAALKNIKAPVMGFYGGNDARVTSTVESTAAKMKELGKSYVPHVFDGAGHGFLKNQATEANYKAATEAWPLTIAFLTKNLK